MSREPTFSNRVVCFCSQLLGTVLGLELGHVKLAEAAFVVHVADLPEHGPLRPALVVDAAYGPHAPCGGTPTTNR